MAGSAGGGGGGGGASGGGSGGGAAGSAGGTGGSAPSGGQGATQKAGPVEVLDAQGNSLGEFGRDGKPMAPTVSTTPSKPAEEKRERDPARELVEQLAKAVAAPDRKSEADAVRAIEQRAELADAAYLKAKQPALDALPKQADGAVAVNDRLAELRKRDVEPVSADTSRRWAEADARDFRQLREQPRQEDAAVAMAEVARTNAAYRAALTEKAPDVAERVNTLDASNAAKEAAKSARKEAEFADMQQSKSAANEATPPRGDAANDARRGAAMNVDADSAQRVAAARERDTRKAAEEMGLNRVEPSLDRKPQPLDADADNKRSAWVAKGQAAPEAEASAAPKPAPRSGARDNQVESDEPMTARTDVKLPVPKEVEDKYLRVGDKFYDPRNKDKLAFEDKGSRLETRSNSEQDAQAMVAIAKARGWDEIKVSGSETFRKEAWLAAAADGMQVRGYTPTEMDKAELAKRAKDAPTNKVEATAAAAPIRARETEAEAPAQPKSKEAVSAREAMENVQRAHQAQAESDRHARADAFARRTPGEAVKEHPELAPAYAAVAAAQSKVDADRLPAEQKAVVMARVRQNVQNSIERGDIPEVQMREEREVSRDLARGRSEDREVSR